jgi:propanol-preferring alcohol dehydrogenase
MKPKRHEIVHKGVRCIADDIFGIVLNDITMRGSIVGTRLDLQESLDFAAQGKVEANVSADKLENITNLFACLHEGRVEGRVVLDLAA